MCVYSEVSPDQLETRSRFWLPALFMYVQVLLVFVWMHIRVLLSVLICVFCHMRDMCVCICTFGFHIQHPYWLNL